MKNPWNKDHSRSDHQDSTDTKISSLFRVENRSFFFFIILFTLFLLQGCTETLVNGGGSGAGSNGDTPVLEESSGDSDGIDAGDTKQSPLIGLPIPSLEAEHLSASLTTGSDADGNAVFQAGPGALPANETVLITNASEELAKAQIMHDRYQGISGKFNYALDAVKDKVYSSMVSVAVADDSCDFDGVLAPVNSDGSVNATAIPNYTNGQTLTYAFVDLENCEVGDSTSEIALANVVYTAQAAPGPDALSKNDLGEVYQVAQDDDDTSRIVKFDIGSEGPNMDNANGANFDTDYGYSRVEGAKDAVYMDEGYHAFLNTDLVDYYNVASCGLNSNFEYECDLIDSIYDSNTGCDPATGCAPKNVKVREGKVYYGTELDVSTTLHNFTVIPELKDNSNDKINLFPDPNTPDIQFLRSANAPYTNSSASHPGFKGARFFDVNEDSVTNEALDILTIIQGSSDEFQLVARYEKVAAPDKPVLLLDVSSLTSPQDLRIYEFQDEEDQDDCSNSASWENGSAAILTASTVEFLSYDLKDTNCEEDEFELDPYQDGLHLTHLTGNTINIDGVIDWDLSDDLEKAYVLSKPDGGDAQVSVVDLETKSVTETVDLKDELFNGKDINVSPKSIIYHQGNEGEKLLISTDEYKVLMSYDLD